MLSKNELTALGVGCIAVAAVLALASLATSHLRKYYAFATATIVTVAAGPEKDTSITSITFAGADGKVISADGITYKSALNGGKAAAAGVTFPVRYLQDTPALTVLQDSDHLSVKMMRALEHPVVYGILAGVFVVSGSAALMEANTPARKVASETLTRVKEYVKRGKERASGAAEASEEAFW